MFLVKVRSKKSKGKLKALVIYFVFISLFFNLFVVCWCLNVFWYKTKSADREFLLIDQALKPRPLDVFLWALYLKHLHIWKNTLVFLWKDSTPPRQGSNSPLPSTDDSQIPVGAWGRGKDVEATNWSAHNACVWALTVQYLFREKEQGGTSVVMM